MWSIFDVFLIKRNSFSTPPQFMREVVMCPKWWVFAKDFWYFIKKLFEIYSDWHITHPKIHLLAFVQSLTRWYFERILKSLSPSINDPILTNYGFYTNNGLDTNFINKILLSLIEWWSLRKYSIGFLKLSWYHQVLHKYFLEKS